jgi:hypothetical protein
VGVGWNLPGAIDLGCALQKSRQGSNDVLSVVSVEGTF